LFHQIYSSYHFFSLKVNDDDDVEIKIYSDEELEEIDSDDVKGEIAILEDARSKMKPNMTAIREYKKKEEEYNAKFKELELVSEQRDEKRKTFEDLRKRRLDEFMEGFSIISMKLREMYQMITLGGDAELELNDRLDPFSEGTAVAIITNSFLTNYRNHLFRSSTKKELEEYSKFIRRRKNALLPCSCICPSPLQANAYLYYG